MMGQEDEEKEEETEEQEEKKGEEEKEGEEELQDKEEHICWSYEKNRHLHICNAAVSCMSVTLS